MNEELDQEATANRVRQLLAAASVAPAMEPQPGFSARVRARLDADQQACGEAGSWIDALLAWSRPALVTATAAVAFAAAGWLTEERAARRAPAGWALDPLAWAIAPVAPESGGDA
jgi:hypothetical protein